MYNSIVMTSGISLLGASNYFGRWSREGQYFVFHGPNPSFKEGDVKEKALQKWLNAAEALLAKREWDPERVSAEYSMLHALERLGKLGESPTITLFHTDTLGGVASAKLLERLLQREFSAQVNLRAVNIDVNDRVVLNRLLGDYMYELSKALLIGDPSGTSFAPIGGYKVMTSFGYLVGSFHGYPTAYLHEDSQQMLHIIPPVPIDINPTFFQEHAPFIRRLTVEGLLDYESLTWEEKSLVETHTSLFTVDDGVVYLNPFGSFLFSREQYKEKLSTKVYISEAVQQVLDAHPSQRRFVYQQIGVLMEYVKGSEVEKRGELFHERDFTQLKGKNFPFHLYKGASNGGLFRATWRYDAQQDMLFVNTVWLSKPYEHEIIRGKGLTQAEGDFLDVTEQVYERL